MEPSQIEQRLAAIESRLTNLEGGKKIVVQAESQPSVKPSNEYEFNDIGHQPEQKKIEAKPGNWLGIIGIICFVMAAGFIIKLSVESGWLTPVRQIGLAVLFGASLIGAGFGLMRSDREYASFLPAAGVIVFYLSVFAGHRYYHVVSFEVALGLASLVSGLCVWLYTKIKNDIYPIAAAIGAYTAPVILGLNVDGVFSLYYFLLCSIVFATISIFLTSRALMLVAAYLSIAVTSYVGLDLDQDGLIACILPIHFLIFSVDSYLYSRETNIPLSEGEAWCFMPVLLIFYAMEYYLIDHIHPGLAPWVSLAFAGFLVGLYWLAKKRFSQSLGSQSLILSFATIVAFHSIYLELLPHSIRPWLFVLILIGGAFAPAGLSKKCEGVWTVPALALFAILAIEYLSIAYHLVDDNGSSWVGVAFAALAALWLIIAKASKFSTDHSLPHMLLGAAHVLAILGFYRLTEDIGSLAVSASWLFYGVAVIVFAVIRKDQGMAKSALFVLGFAAGKALLYDAASAPTAIRILCLILTGAVLYGCGFFMRKVSDWKDA